jgi:hypothetical protein
LSLSCSAGVSAASSFSSLATCLVSVSSTIARPCAALRGQRDQLAAPVIGIWPALGHSGALETVEPCRHAACG